MDPTFTFRTEIYILIDPQSGAITGIIDWEAAAFPPLWAEVRTQNYMVQYI